MKISQAAFNTALVLQNPLYLFYPQLALQTPCIFPTLTSSVGSPAPFPPRTNHQLRDRYIAWSATCGWVSNFFYLSMSYILQSGNLNFSWLSLCLLWASEQSRSYKLGTSQHHFVPHKSIIMSLQSFEFLKSDDIQHLYTRGWQGSSILGESILSISHYPQDTTYILNKIPCFLRGLI
jgi:hypothetical protein